jgi:hypothetical protein
LSVGVAAVAVDEHSRDTEVEEFDLAAWGDFDVGGFEVPMDQPALVGDIECFADPACDGARFGNRQGSGLEPNRQRLPFNQLEHESANAVDLDNVVNGGDPGMVQRGQCAGLALEALEVIAAGRGCGGQHLERDVSIEPRIVRAEHLAHTARAEQRLHCEYAETGARGQCHAPRILQRAAFQPFAWSGHPRFRGHGNA